MTYFELQHRANSMVSEDIFSKFITNMAYVRSSFSINGWDAAMCLASKALTYIIIA